MGENAGENRTVPLLPILSARAYAKWLVKKAIPLATRRHGLQCESPTDSGASRPLLKFVRACETKALTVGLAESSVRAWWLFVGGLMNSSNVTII